MRCRACNSPISVRDNRKSGKLEDLCSVCKRLSRITSDYESESDKETEDLKHLIFGDRKRRTEE